MNRRLLFFLPAVLAVQAVGAQSNSVIDTILEMEVASHGAAAYLAFVAAGVADDEAAFEEAFSRAVESGVFPADATPGAGISLGRYAYLLMATFDAPGGILYSVFPGGRYATRELAFHGLIPGRTDPFRSISGTEAMQILERFLRWRQG